MLPTDPQTTAYAVLALVTTLTLVGWGGWGRTAQSRPARRLLVRTFGRRWRVLPRPTWQFPTPTAGGGHAVEAYDAPSAVPGLRFADGPRAPGFVDASDLDDPMLTDKERIRRLIATEGGRMRQRMLVERTGWSKSRVSRLLSVMVDDGTLVKLQVGRENLVCLEDTLPDIVAGSDDRHDSR